MVNCFVTVFYKNRMPIAYYKLASLNLSIDGNKVGCKNIQK